MKNKTRKIHLLIYAILLALGLTACRDSGNTNTTDESIQTEDVASTESDTETDNTAVTGKFASIEEFIESDLFQEQTANQIAGLEESGFSLDFSASENKLIWNFKITDPELSAAVDVSSLESSLSSQASTFESVAEVLPTAIDVDNPIIIVRYLDNNGNELASKEFSALNNDTSTDTTNQ